MREEAKIFIALALFGAMLTLHTCTSEAATLEPDTALWLARSCVGEAGFNSGGNGECAAILSIYRKRMMPSGLSLYEVARKYSAAIKASWNKKHPWVFTLGRDLKEPRYWPASRVPWRNYLNRWREVLVLCDDFVKGRIIDPLPEADHYGCAADRLRAMQEGWYRIKTDFRNEYWSINDPHRRRNRMSKQTVVTLQDTVDVDDAAKILNVSGSQLRVYARAGKFKTARKVRGTRWLFSRSEMEGIASGKIEIDFTGAWGVLYGKES